MLAKNFSDLAKDINVQILKAQQILNRINPKKSMLIRNHIAKNEKKKKVMKANQRETCVAYSGIRI